MITDCVQKTPATNMLYWG